MRIYRVRHWSFLCVLGCTVGIIFSGKCYAETLTSHMADSRATLAYRVEADAAQRWLPKPWKLNPVANGPFKGANVFIVLIDRLLHRDAKGKPAAGGSYLMAGLLIPAIDPAGKTGAPFVVRIYSPLGGPGPYQNTQRATVKRDAMLRRPDMGLGTGTETWTINVEGGGSLTIAMEYRHATPKWMKGEVRPRSAVEPTFYRIYRFEQLIDLVKSVPAGVDRTKKVSLDVKIPELRAMFDGSETLIGIALVPWYKRQTLLP